MRSVWSLVLLLALSGPAPAFDLGNTARGDGTGDLAGDGRARCEIECPSWWWPEGEPPLAIDYEDTWNGGCNTDWFDPPLQHIWCVWPIHGVSGFYLYQGGQYRDTDWYQTTIGPGGLVEIDCDAEVASYLFELGPQNCDEVDVAYRTAKLPMITYSTSTVFTVRRIPPAASRAR